VRARVELACFAMGLTVIVAGIAQISVPIAFICGGVMLSFLSILSRFSK
jgi:hypothetical protein